MTDVTFYSQGDERYFLGTVALVNSLRMVGHDERIVILDCGFTTQQRAILARECTIMNAPASYAGTFSMDLKLVAPGTDRSEIAVLIDSDIIVTGRLDGLIESAAGGKVAAYADPDSGRWFAEWEWVFDLPRPPRRDTYICAGLLAVSSRLEPDLISRWREACHGIPRSPASSSEPTAELDQDALNAILMGYYPRGAVAIAPAHEVAQARELRLGLVEITDLVNLECTLDGLPVRVLHAAGKPKPWLSRVARRGAYTTLLRRLLACDDVALQVRRSEIPAWLRDGGVARIDRWLSERYARVRQAASGRLGWLSPRIRRTVSRILP